MAQIIIYSVLLLIGMAVSQVWELENIKGVLSIVTMVCLSYIMIEVGLEFKLDKKRLKSYGWDYVVAATAAAFPWIFCAVYFIAFFDTPWKEALLVGRFAAPTSAGVLFAMLAAAGLASTWLFKKAQVLAIFDDLDTVLLMIPLQMLFVGLKPELFFVVAIICGLLAAAYYWLHSLRLPSKTGWLLCYGTLLVILTQLLERATHIHLEVLLPAFVLGCILYNPHDDDPKNEKKYLHEHAFLEPEEPRPRLFDKMIKGVFMLLVGCSLPKVSFGEINLNQLILHVLALTFLSNLGKCFPAFCYRQEASMRERIALSIAMFPRGEVGAGVLLIALNYGLTGIPATLSIISLALNLVLTGFFIAAVKWLIAKSPQKN
ncbi:MAG: cation:proton antiporter [Candidatus Omnitrophica bacterium]|nr:cation:proton antiporter [Candidatus Omnitrophota bacterium]